MNFFRMRCPLTLRNYCCWMAKMSAQAYRQPRQKSMKRREMKGLEGRYLRVQLADGGPDFISQLLGQAFDDAGILTFHHHPDHRLGARGTQ